MEVDDSADPGGAVGVFDHGRAETDSVMRLAEAGIDGSLQELVDGRRCGNRRCRDCRDDQSTSRRD